MEETPKERAEEYEQRVGYVSDTKLMEYFSAVPLGSLVLDVGCGHGRNTLELSSKGYKVLGLDCNRFSLYKAKEKNLDVMSADCKNVPFKPETFDAVVSIGLMQCLGTDMNVRNTVKEMARTMKKSGRLFLSCFSDHNRDANSTTHLYLSREYLTYILTLNELDIVEYSHETRDNKGIHYFVCRKSM